MTRPIDEKLVQIKLDNSDFTKKASDTVGIFGKLSAAFKSLSPIDLSKTISGIKALNGNIGKTDVSKIAEDVDVVASRFSSLGIIGVAVLQNIANRVTDLGLRMGKALTVQPLLDGMGEYEIKLKSIQTIMSNTMGKNTLEDVTGVLNELNQYADQTIYNFAEMTRNIGTFTAAGVGLEDAAVSIKGIANLAAASGSNSQQASTAMYQLSQALATGTVKLMDWNSVVNAGMGGKLFQNALKETGKQLGVNTYEALSFRDSLEHGWLTSEVLLETLKKFAADQSMIDAATKVRTFTQLIDTTKEALGSGWAQSWEILIGDFNEATEVWTGVSNTLGEVINATADARNKLLNSFVDLGGRTDIIETVKSAYFGLVDILGEVRKAWESVFPPVTAQTLKDIVGGIREFVENLRMSEEQLANVKTIFEGFFSLLNTGFTIVKLLGGTLAMLIPPGLVDVILNFAAYVGTIFIELNNAVEAGGKFTETFGSFGRVMEAIGNGIGKAGEYAIAMLKGTRSIASEISKFLKPIVDGIKEVVLEIAGEAQMQDLVNGGVLGLILVILGKIMTSSSKITDIFKSAGKVFSNLEDLSANIGELLSSVGEALNVFTASIRADALMKIAIALGVMAVSLKLLSTIETTDISKSLFAIATIFFMLTKTMSSLEDMKLGVSTAIATVILPALAASVLVLAGALKLLSTIDSEDMVTGTLTLVTIVGVLVVAMSSLSKISGKISVSSVAFVALATSVLILTNAVKTLSGMESGDLAKGVVTITSLLLALGVFLKISSKTKLTMGTALSLAVIAGVIQLMVTAIERISDIPVKQIIKGLGTITIILAQLALFTKLTSGSQLFTAALGMTLVATAINMLVGPLEQFGAMPLGNLFKGLGALAVVLGEIIIAMKLASGGIGGAIAITIAAAAIAILVPPLMALGSMSLASIGKALLVLAGGLGAVALATKLIGPSGVLTLLGFAAAMTAIGIASLGISAAISSVVLAIGVLATMTVSTVGAILDTLGYFLKGVLKLIPDLVTAVMEFGRQFAAALRANLPFIVDSLLYIVTEMLKSLVKYVPKFLKLGIEFVIAIMDGLASKIGPLVDSGVNLVISLVNGMANAIRDNQDELIQSVNNMLEAILEIIVMSFLEIIDVLFGWIPGVSDATKSIGDAAKKALRNAFDIEEVGKEKGAKFVGSILDKKASAATAGTQLATSAKFGLGSINTGPVGNSFVNAFTTGISAMKPGAKLEGKTLGNATKSGVEEISLWSSGQNFGLGFISGLESKKPAVSSSAKSFASTAQRSVRDHLMIRSPSRVMMEMGGQFGEGFLIGIDNKKKSAYEKAKEMAKAAVKAIKDNTRGIDDEMQSDFEFTPVIKPVVDMANFKDIDTSMNAKVGLSTSDLVEKIRAALETQKQAANNVSNAVYNIYITANGELPQETIRRMAAQFQAEIKNQNDRKRLSIGEGVSF